MGDISARFRQKKNPRHKLWTATDIVTVDKTTEFTVSTAGTVQFLQGFG
jgi:hypothetical protein